MPLFCVLFFTFLGFLCMIFLGDDRMKKMNHNGWGLSTMIGFIVGFVLFLIIITILAYRIGAL